MMGPETGNSREHDAGHGSTQGQMHDRLVGYSLTGKTEHQHRNNHQSPANTQKTGQNACNCPYGPIHCQNRYHISFLNIFAGVLVADVKLNLRGAGIRSPLQESKKESIVSEFH